MQIISNHKLVGATWRAANASGGTMAPTLLVLHDTAGRLEKGSSVEWFASKDCNTSAHIVVERDGSVTQMVPFNRKAFHAGRSSWKGREFCNSFSIGIEIVNPGALDRNGKAWFNETFADCVAKDTKEHGAGHKWMPYTPEQVQAVTELCKAIADKYDIEDITAHWAISPGRKVDPCPLFPLEEVRAAVFHKSPVPEAPSAPAPVALVETEKVESDASDITFDWLVEQGCRAAKLYKTARNWFWKLLGFGGATGTVGLIGQATEIDNGTVTAAGSLASDHAVLILGVLVVVLMCALAAVICLGRRYLVSALQRSGYVPKAVA
jgi:N-acetylmuramoyl-L-alanine amidase